MPDHEHPATAQRRLAAVLAADVVGFSRLMGLDEEGTLARIRALRRDIIEPKVTERQGRIVKTTGDGFLAEFQSPVEAVRCALAIQEALITSQAAQEPSTAIQMRIGINLGDILIEADGDIFGDGVNVAARLEQIAEPGAVLVSGGVYEVVRDKVAAGFEDRGEQTVKNIARPVRVYAIRGAANARRDVGPTSLHDRPSIAVLPFKNLSGEAEQDYLVDGITDDIIMSLTKARWLSVAGRNSSFAFRSDLHNPSAVAGKLGARYALVGGVRRGGARVRISAQLVEAQSGRTLWAERYDRDLGDVFALQDEIAEHVAAAIEPELLRSEGELATVRDVPNPTAWDLVRRGMWQFHKVQPETHRAARELFLQAAKRDPQAAEAYLWLGRVDAGLVAYGWTEDPGRISEEGAAAALRAVQLDEQNPYTHYAVAITHIFSGRYDVALQAAHRALALNPSFALGHCVLGLARLYRADAQGAATSLQHGVVLSPFDPQNFTWLRALALAHYFAGQHTAALAAAEQALQLRPGWASASRLAAASRLALGDREAAERIVRDLAKRGELEDEQFAQLRQALPVWMSQLDTTIACLRAGS